MKLTDSWRCLVCDDKGTGPKAQTQAQGHTNKTTHSTVTEARPEKEGG